MRWKPLLWSVWSTWLILGLIACGGGSTPGQPSGAIPDAGRPSSRPMEVVANSSLSQSAGATVPGIAVDRLVKIRETRIGRSFFEYEFKVMARNSGAAATDIVATLLQVPAGAQIVDGVAMVGAIGAGQTIASQDSIVVRVDRTVAFDAAAMIWQFAASTAPPTASIDIAVTVPAAARSQVAQVVSPVATGRVGASMAIDAPGQGGGATVFAADANGNLVLAGTAQPGGQVQLSAATTALELVRLSAPALAGRRSRDAYGALVMAATPFPSLVAAIATAHSSGGVLADDPPTHLALSDVLRVLQQGQAQAASSAAAGSPSKKRALEIDSAERAFGSGPLSLIRTGLRSVHLVNDEPFLGLGGPTPAIQNATPLYWRAAVTQWKGTAAAGEVILEPASLFQLASNPVERFLGIDLPFVGLDKQALPGTSRQSFTLRIDQNAESIVANVGSLLIEAMELAEDLRQTQHCASEITKILLDSDAVQAFVARPSVATLSPLLGDVARDFFADKLYSVLVRRTGFGEVCLKQHSTGLDVGIRYIRTKLKFLAGRLMQLSVVVSVVEVIDKAYLMITNVNTQKQLGVCLEKDGRIRNCAVRFEGNPTRYTVSPGAIIDDWPVSALDARDQETGVPLTLEVSIKPDDARIARREADSPRISALEPGDADVIFFDPAAGGSGSAVLRVVPPKFSKETLKLRVGEVQRLEFVDGAGRLLDFNGETSFASLDTETAAVGAGFLGVGSSPTLATTLQVLGRRTGTTIITAQNKADHTILLARVEVASSNSWAGVWVGKVSSSCGSYSGPIRVVIEDPGGGVISETAFDVTGGSFGPYRLTVSGNIALGIDVQGQKYELDGDSLTATYAPACQSATLSRSL